MNGFDIGAMKQATAKEDEGVEVHIHDAAESPMYYKDADGKEQPVVIVVAGAHSKRHRDAETAIRRRKLRPKSLTSETFYQDGIEKAAACTISWKGFFDGDVEVQCTSTNAAELYRALPWLLDQVTEAMHDHARFFEN